jgi:hypothetical protein
MRPKRERPVVMSQEEIDEIQTRFENGQNIAAICREMNIARPTVVKYTRCDVENKKQAMRDVVIEERSQSYRDNILWAMNTAGEYSRTKTHPITCPNNSAWFLYMQAIDEPKDFMAKVNSIESKSDDGLDKDIIRASKKSLSEIEKFLENAGVYNGQTKITTPSEKETN